MIQAEIDGRSFGQRGAGIVVRLIHNKHRWIRTIQCGKITTNQAELKALEYVLKSIDPKYEEEEIIIKTTGRYALMMLEQKNGEWLRKSGTNTKLVEIIREQYARFTEIQVIHSQELDKIKELNEKAIKSGGQSIFDKRK